MAARLALPDPAGAAPLALAVAALAVALATLRIAPPAAPPPTPDAPPLAQTQFPGPYPARVLRVVDGDTFAARIPLWFGQEIETLVRLRGVDAPERQARCAEEAAGAERAAQALADLLASGKVSLVHVARDKYFGRVVADAVVTSPDGSFPPTEVGPALLAQGAARPYGGGARASWCALRAAL